MQPKRLDLPLAPSRRRGRAGLLTAAVVTAAALALTACGSSGGGGGSTAGGGGSGGGSKVSVTMGDNSAPDMDYLPLEMALKTMSSTYDVHKTIQFNSDDIALQSLQQNKIQFMTESVPPAATALAKLPNIVAVGTRANDQWDMVAKNSITSCKQLNGKRLGLFSRTGVSTAYVQLYFKQECPNIKPTTIITPDSTLRRQALQAGQLDATPLQATDAVQILNGPDKSKFHELVNFAQALPGIGRDLLLTNKQTLEKHPEVVAAFLKAQIQAIRGFYAKPSTIPGLMNTYLPGAAPKGTVAEIGNYFVSRKLFCANGGLGDTSVADSLKAFGDGGFLPKSVKASQLVDDTQMKKVLAQIGPSSATPC